MPQRTQRRALVDDRALRESRQETFQSGTLETLPHQRESLWRTWQRADEHRVLWSLLHLVDLVKVCVLSPSCHTPTKRTGNDVRSLCPLESHE